ncbi:MAG: hypothetical protein ABIC19_01960 [Patescibacteria group bacterium]|nr:hypothetical protein [Patescibacteria group bacterium]
MEKFGEKFLHQKDSSLHTSKPVENTQRRRKARGEEISRKPEDKIASYLERLEIAFNPKPLDNDPGFGRKERNIYLLKKGLYESVIIKPQDIPESYFKNQRRLAREQGHGDIEITDQVKEEAAEIIIADQRSTLDNWIDYFTSSDSDSYPAWAKYWAFQGMLRLSTYDKEKQAFGKRKKDTTAPFPDLNREALAYAVDAVIKKVEKEELPTDDPEFKKILQGANFGKLYAWAIEKVTPAKESELSNTRGQWVKFNKGSDHSPLVRSLEGHGTGWCTAAESTAKTQLQGGDFHVYYSHDDKGKPTIPRVAIRMEDEKIAEVRGVAHQQNLDPDMADSDILEKKLREFGQEGEKYQKKTADMKRLTEIEGKVKEGKELTKQDLRFLYEVDEEILGFGYKKDPRIEEILAMRQDMREDLALALDCKKNEISFTAEEALSGGIKFHWDCLDLPGLTSAESLVLPKSVGGDLDLSNLTSAEGLVLPKSIGVNLVLSNLTSAKGLTFPESVRGHLYLPGLTSAEGLVLPKLVGWNLDLSSLTSAESLVLPESIGGHLDLSSLTSAESLVLPKSVGGDLDLSRLPLEEREMLREKYPKLRIKPR